MVVVNIGLDAFWTVDWFDKHVGRFGDVCAYIVFIQFCLFDIRFVKDIFSSTKLYMLSFYNYEYLSLCRKMAEKGQCLIYFKC